MLLDPQDEPYDRRLGNHLISLYHGEEDKEEVEHLDISLLKDYLGYARANFNPILSREAREALKHAYVEMRKIGASKGQVSAYPRQLESLIRLAEAHAKLRFKNTVDIDDVEEAKRLHREALKQSCIDPCSGKIDISILTTGLSVTNRKRREEIVAGLKSLLLGMKKQQDASLASKTDSQEEEQQQDLSLASQHLGFNIQDVFDKFRETSQLMITREMFDEALKQLKEDGFLTIVGGRKIRLI